MSLLSAAFRQCQALTRREAKNFYFAFRVLPPGPRRAMYVLYAFCRVADDIVDGHAPEDTKRRQLDRLETALTACYRGQPRGGLFRALAAVTRRYRIPVDELREVVDGCRQDLDTSRYRTFEDLTGYCWKVSCIIGQMTIRVADRDPAPLADYILHGGLAVQLTNILRDVAEDAARNRIYLPLEDLERFGVDPGEILARRFSPAFEALMRFQVDRVRGLYRRAARTPAELRAPLVTLELIQRIYAGVLEQIPAQGYDVFRSRAGISTGRKLRLVLGYLLGRRLGLGS